uniref:Uncharacterized protein n=1 Tax=Podarcis muralis TaxID=64176 RepID=A0A670KCN7_PODMU
MSLIMLLTPKWKEAKIKANQEWIQKLMEYAEIVRLTGIIINQENKHFIKECVASEYRLLAPLPDRRRHPSSPDI